METARTLLERGNALYLRGRYAEAAEAYREALRHDGTELDALNNLGAALADLGQLSEAVSCYREVLRLRPERADTLYNLGNALRLLGRFEEAVESYARALRLRPDWAEVHNNLGIALLKLGRRTEAMTSLRRALELKPAYALALVNLGLALAESGRVAEALACYEEALRLEPENPDAHRNRSLAWLLLGDWERGFPEYQWRWRCSDFRPLPLREPLWDGSPLEGRRILLYTEQGAGDTLQFVRYANVVKAMGGTVLLAAPERLHPILTTARGIDQLVPNEGRVPPFDVHLPLLSVPAVVGTSTATVPVDIPYLAAEPSRVERWERELGPREGLRVGIAWHGNPTTLHYNGRRSIPLAQFEPLARVEGVRLYSLQIGPGSEQVEALADRFPVVDLAGRLDERAGAFLDTAAVMTRLDLVVTCDTSIAHLAGALGVEAWIALPSVPDWRWLLDRDDTPWYPRALLFRQEVTGRWEEPFRRMAERLRREVARRHRVPAGN